MKHTVCVLGEGAWGTAIATVFAHNGHTVRLWCHNEQVAEDITRSGYNSRYLPQVPLSDRITPEVDIQQALKGVQYIFHAIPVKYMRTVLQQARPYYTPYQSWVILSKGIEQHTLQLPSHIIDHVMGVQVKTAILFGPSFAQEVATGQMTGVVLAGADSNQVSSIQALCATDYFSLRLSSDIIGLQLCGAYKNVIALAVGYLEGAGHGYNAQAFLITRGLQEMVTLVAFFGGDVQTVYGLAGIGDLVLTATSNVSKNRHVGTLLGKGNSLETIIASTGYTPEGINTLQSLHQLLEQQSIDLSICRSMYQIIFNRSSDKNIVRKLYE